MSALTITKTIEFAEEPTRDGVIERIESALNEEFAKVKISSTNQGDNPYMTCRVKTKLLNPIVSLKGPMKIQTKGNKARIMIDADTTTNGWFWFTMLIGILFPLLWILMIVMYFTQKKASMTSLEKVFERVAFESTADF